MTLLMFQNWVLADTKPLGGTVAPINGLCLFSWDVNSSTSLSCVVKAKLNLPCTPGHSNLRLWRLNGLTIARQLLSEIFLLRGSIKKINLSQLCSAVLYSAGVSFHKITFIYHRLLNIKIDLAQVKEQGWVNHLLNSLQAASINVLFLRESAGF